eukprot:gene1810-33229_t
MTNTVDPFGQTLVRNGAPPSEQPSNLSTRRPSSTPCPSIPAPFHPSTRRPRRCPPGHPSTRAHPSSHSTLPPRRPCGHPGGQTPVPPTTGATPLPAAHPAQSTLPRLQVPRSFSRGPALSQFRRSLRTTRDGLHIHILCSALNIVYSRDWLKLSETAALIRRWPDVSECLNCDSLLWFHLGWARAATSSDSAGHCA